jgi:hypothetical protein
MRIVYLILAAIGGVGTWIFNLRSMAAGEDYLAGWFASAASTSAAVDVIVVAFAACAFMVVEGRRLRMSRAVWLLVPLSFVIAIAFTFPLFLAWREHHLVRTADRGTTVVRTAPVAS